MPIWVRREKERELQAAGKAELPWPLYLVGSVLVAIASVSGSQVASPADSRLQQVSCHHGTATPHVLVLSIVCLSKAPGKCAAIKHYQQSWFAGTQVQPAG